MVNFQVICKDAEACAKLGEELHNKLVGCKDYIDNNIVLNVDGELCNIIIDMQHTNTMPVVSFHHRRPRYGAYEIDIHHYEELTSNHDVSKSDLDPFIVVQMLKDPIDIYSVFPDIGCESGVRSSDYDENKNFHYVSYIVVPENVDIDFDIHFVSKNIRFHNGIISSVVV